MLPKLLVGFCTEWCVECPYTIRRLVTKWHQTEKYTCILGYNETKTGVETVQLSTIKIYYQEPGHTTQMTNVVIRQQAYTIVDENYYQ